MNGESSKVPPKQNHTNIAVSGQDSQSDLIYAHLSIRASRRDNNVRRKRKIRCKKLLDKYPVEDVKKIIFTDEKKINRNFIHLKL